MSISDIREMTVVERIQAMEMLWDSLCGEGAELASPDCHEGVLEERRRSQDTGEATFMTLQEIKRMSRK